MKTSVVWAFGRKARILFVVGGGGQVNEAKSESGGYESRSCEGNPLARPKITKCDHRNAEYD